MLESGRSPMAGSEATPRRADPAALVERMLGGDRLALARLITHLENRSAAVPAIMQAIHARGREAYVVGVTGPPGAGKSTVVDRLTALLRAEDETVGIGAGQTELDIMKIADTTVVVLVPESGDAIQTMKAGLMEVADVFVVNKADRAGAPALMAELKFAAHLHASSTASRRDVEWETPVLSLQAQHGVGIQELLADIRRHRAALEGSGAFAARRRERARAELEALLVDAFRGRVDRALHAGRVKAVFDEVVAGARDPYSAAAAILPVISLESS